MGNTITFPDGKYKGQSLHNKPHGKGIYQYNNGDVFKGEFSAGNLIKGIYQYANGDIHEGNFVNNKPCGVGKLIEKSSGNIYEGSWNDGVITYGMIIYEDGARYKGSIKNKKRHGPGMFFKDRVNSIGEWTEDKFTGSSSLVLLDGDYYGDIVLDKRHGNGVMKYHNGNHYDGDWIDDKPHGQGIMCYSNGDQYEGNWTAGNKHGQGKFTQVGGYIREGEWTKDRFTGNGSIKYPNGSKYTGDFVLDKKHGKGKYEGCKGTIINGKYISVGSNILIQEGDWFEDKFTGYGIFHFPDGIYTGYVVLDKRHGRGVLENTDYTYDGEWFEDRKDGFGVCTYKQNGDKYTGEWRANNYHGKGTYVQEGVYVQEGQWTNGKFTGYGSTITYGSVLDPKLSPYTKSKKITTIYIGDFVLGKKHGKGRLIEYQNGKKEPPQIGWFLSDEFLGNELDDRDIDHLFPKYTRSNLQDESNVSVNTQLESCKLEPPSAPLQIGEKDQIEGE
jgi:hypothetical protein